MLLLRFRKTVTLSAGLRRLILNILLSTSWSCEYIAAFFVSIKREVHLEGLMGFCK